MQKVQRVAIDQPSLALPQQIQKIQTVLDEAVRDIVNDRHLTRHFHQAVSVLSAPARAMLHTLSHSQSPVRLFKPANKILNPIPTPIRTRTPDLTVNKPGSGQIPGLSA